MGWMVASDLPVKRSRRDRFVVAWVNARMDCPFPNGRSCNMRYIKYQTQFLSGILLN